MAKALHVAAELEHALCCCYLFAAFSLKRDPDEGGVTWPQLKMTRDWSVQILLVARQEMEHLGLVCNLLLAIGELPQLGRRKFPYHSGIPTDIPELTLQPFSLDTMRRFVDYERPDFDILSRSIKDKIKAKTLAEALEATVDIICAETGWEYGQGWMNAQETGEWVPVTHACAEIELAENLQQMQTRVCASLDIEPGTNATLHQKIELSHLKPRRCHHDDADYNISIFSIGNVESGPDAKPGHDKHTPAKLAFVHCQTCQSMDDGAAVKLVSLALEQCADAFSACIENDRLNAATEAMALRERAQHMFKPGSPASIGAMYRNLLRAIHYLDDGKLFVGNTDSQVDDKDLTLVFPDWFNMQFHTISDFATAKSAINQIMEEGEGTASLHATALDPQKTVDLGADTSHFARFKAVRDQMAGVNDANFQPARRAAPNPRVSDASVANTAELMSIFNASYSLMLEIIIAFFGGTSRIHSSDQRVHSAMPHVFLPMMSMIIRTLGESLTLCPMHDDAHSPVASGSYEIDGPIGVDATLAEGWEKMCVKLQALSQRSRLLSEKQEGWASTSDLQEVQSRLDSAAKNLNRLAFNLKERMQSKPLAKPPVSKNSKAGAN